MNVHSFSVGFIPKLVAGDVFRRWYLLNTLDSNRMKWFSDFLLADNQIIDKVCCNILLTIFGIMEKALTSEEDISFEKLFHDYLVKGVEFKRLIDSELPKKLAHNRPCNIYLVYSLKVFLTIGSMRWCMI